GTNDAPKALVIVGGAATVIVAVLLVAPVPPLADVTAPVVLFLTPAVVPVTVIVKLQFPAAAIVAPLSVIVLPPVVVNVPPHCDVEPFATGALLPHECERRGALNGRRKRCSRALGDLLVAYCGIHHCRHTEGRAGRISSAD